jgi:glycosyltransferase involved in cell wall biosynthesis
LIGTDFKVYRLGPIAAYDTSAHSIHQILMSNFFAKYGIDSFLYLRNLKTNGKTKKELSNFLGVDFPENLFVRFSPKHKGLGSLINFINLLKDLKENRRSQNWLFLSKAEHVLKLSRLRSLLNFKIVFENHQNKPFTEATSKADLTYVLSPEVYEELKDSYRVKLWNYHYPVREEFLNLKPEFREKDVYTLGYVGSLKPEKGLEFLLKVVRELPVKLKVVGGSQEQVKKARELARTYGVIRKVEFTGFVPQDLIPLELSGVDILVAPFTEEQTTIPLKVYEYLATGLPVISSNIKPVKVVAGELFYYYEPENSKSFIKSFRELTANVEKTRERMIKSKVYAKRFHWKEVVRKIVADLVKAGE